MYPNQTLAFLYKWTHIPTQKWYGGSRTAKGCHPDDGYICSSIGVRQMIINDRANWVREILVVGEPRYIRMLEGEYLTALNAQADPVSYNGHNAKSEWHRTGKPQSDATKKKLAAINTGKHHSDKTKAQMSIDRTGAGNSFFGKSHSAETCAHLAAINTGTTRPDEVKAKIAVTLTGTTRPDEVKDKIANTVRNLPKISCIACHGEFLPAQYGRFHGSKCKLYKGGDNV